MPSIRKLEPKLYTRLRSQAIIESIPDVVRELINNSVDAQASVVSIYLDLESLSVCVEDNGSGISPPDMKFIGRRYHTTKYNEECTKIYGKSFESLLPISDPNNQTLGFRGEALSCIADQCSKLVLASAVNDKVDFTVVNGSNSQDLVKTLLCFFGLHPPLKGTIVVASRLFYNMPVRMKYVREKCHKISIATEIRRMIFQTFAHRPFMNITASFFEKGEQQIFLSTDFHSKPETLFSSLFSASFSYLRKISGFQDDSSMEGFFGISYDIRSPMYFIFCNGVPIQLTHKKTHSIRSALKLAVKENGISATKSGRLVISASFDVNSKKEKTEIHNTGDLFQIRWGVFLRLLELGLGITSKNKARIQERISREKSTTITRKNDDNSDTLSPESTQITTLSILEGKLKLISQVNRSFILANINDRLFALDQHACDERVTVEELFKSYIKSVFDPECDLRVKCKKTISMNIAPEDISLVEKKHFIMTQLGFDYLLEEGKIKITHLPIYLHKYDEPALFKSCLLHKFGEENNEQMLGLGNANGEWLLYMDRLPKALKEAIVSFACRSSIKFGQALTMEEMTYLLKNLGACSLPFQCAHGRPTVVSVADITRIGNYADDYEL